MESTILKNGKELKLGFTTGSCATAASASALEMLLSGEILSVVSIKLPSGEEALFDLENIKVKPDFAEVAVVKDGGDDPDVTTGTKIYAKVSLTEKEIAIDGGKGVGRVTKRGLKCQVGEAAINPVPRKMMEENLYRIMEKYGYKGGVSVIISVPEGEKLAKKTYNPRLGIVGGISILGTTGIVEPMSEKALVDTIKVMADKRYVDTDEIILISPGNYGKEFCKDYFGIDLEDAVTISNYVGEALDYIKYKGFQRVLFVGHIGKLVKCAAGVMNTHSYYADGRMEVIGVHCAMAGAPAEKVSKIMECISTDEAFDIIKEEPYFEQVKKTIMDKVMYHLNFRLKGEVEVGAVMFSSGRDHIIKSENADDLIELVVTYAGKEHKIEE